MQYTGVFRRIDRSGRLVIPIDLRNRLGFMDKDALEFLIDDDKLVLRKYQPTCIFCGKAGEMIVFKGKNVCGKCADRIHMIAADE